MDCDLQHPAETLIEMYQKWKEGYEVIEGVKKSREKRVFFIKKVPASSMESCQKQQKWICRMLLISR